MYARSCYTPYVNGAFTFAAGSVTYKLKLIAVHDLGPVGTTSDPNRFRLIFRTAAAGPSQQTGTLRRSGFTATPLFVVPIDSASRTYEAVINRTG